MRSFVVLAALIGLVAAVAILPKPEKKSVSPICGYCEMLVEELESEVENDEPALEKKANAWCESKFGTGLMANLCKAAVDEELHKIVDDIQNKESPDVICAQVHICKNSVKH